MKIAFNSYGVGYGNNGGTQTVYRMAIALSEMGHKVELLSHVKNCFTWFTLPKNVKHITSNKTDADVVVDVSTASIKYVKSKDKRFLWLRGLETWRISLEEILQDVINYEGEVLVNSKRLQNVFIKNLGLTYKIQYSGIPIDDFVNSNSKSDGFSIGALYSKRKIKNWALSDYVFNNLKKNYGDKFKFFAFGVDEMKKGSVYYAKNPSFNHKLKILNSCDLWLATSINEGLHIPPMEASLCGACIVAPKNEDSGVMDYAKEGTALMYVSREEAYEKVVYAIEHREEIKSLNESMNKIIRDEIGDIQMNADKLMKIIGD